MLLLHVILVIGLAEQGPLRPGDHFDQGLVKRVRPVYPPLAKQAGVQGVVRCEVLVGRDGSVRSVKRISGHPMLAKSAMEAIRQWRYKPTLLNGKPVENIGQTEVTFQLSGNP